VPILEPPLLTGLPRWVLRRPRLNMMQALNENSLHMAITTIEVRQSELTGAAATAHLGTPIPVVAFEVRWQEDEGDDLTVRRCYVAVDVVWQMRCPYEVQRIPLVTDKQIAEYRRERERWRDRLIESPYPLDPPPDPQDGPGLIIALEHNVGRRFSLYYSERPGRSWKVNPL
jgi:hypothetical protein